jgi:hypothetical protein
MNLSSFSVFMHVIIFNPIQKNHYKTIVTLIFIIPQNIFSIFFTYFLGFLFSPVLSFVSSSPFLFALCHCVFTIKLCCWNMSPYIVF